MDIKEIWLRESLAQKTKLKYDEWRKKLTPEFLKKNNLLIKNERIQSLKQIRWSHIIVAEYNKIKKESIFNLLYGKEPSYKIHTFLKKNNNPSRKP